MDTFSVERVKEMFHDRAKQPQKAEGHIKLELDLQVFPYTGHRRSLSLVLSLGWRFAFPYL